MSHGYQKIYLAAGPWLPGNSQSGAAPRPGGVAEQVPGAPLFRPSGPAKARKNRMMVSHSLTLAR